jgi:phosphoribosylanthranilate isomerase
VTWVKVCGLSTTGDVAVATESGADAIGLVLIAESPRAVTIEQARSLAEQTELTRVILTRDLPPADLLATALAVGADGVQPYGRHQREAAAAAAGAGYLVLLPLHVDRPITLGDVPADQVPLLDNGGPDKLGGSGQTFDHSHLPPPTRRFVLAGGLHPGNVAELLGSSGAWGVDASSGLESRPGVKDPDLIRSFVKAAKQT